MNGRSNALSAAFLAAAFSLVLLSSSQTSQAQGLLLQNQSTGRCLDIYGQGGEGTPLITYDCTGAWNQRFVYDNGRIRVQDTDLCLDVEMGEDGQNTTGRIVVWSCHTDWNQEWHLVPLDNGTFFIGTDWADNNAPRDRTLFDAGHGQGIGLLYGDGPNMVWQWADMDNSSASAGVPPQGSAVDPGSLAGNNGAGIVGTNAGGIVANGGGNIVANGGGNIVANGGGNIVANGGGNAVGAGVRAMTGDITPEVQRGDEVQRVANEIRNLIGSSSGDLTGQIAGIIASAQVSERLDEGEGAVLVSAIVEGIDAVVPAGYSGAKPTGSYVEVEDLADDVNGALQGRALLPSSFYRELEGRGRSAGRMAWQGQPASDPAPEVEASQPASAGPAEETAVTTEPAVEQGVQEENAAASTSDDTPEGLLQRAEELRAKVADLEQKAAAAKNDQKRQNLLDRAKKMREQADDLEAKAARKRGN